MALAVMAMADAQAAARDGRATLAAHDFYRRDKVAPRRNIRAMAFHATFTPTPLLMRFVVAARR